MAEALRHWPERTITPAQVEDSGACSCLIIDADCSAAVSTIDLLVARFPPGDQNSGEVGVQEILDFLTACFNGLLGAHGSGALESGHRGAEVRPRGQSAEASPGVRTADDRAAVHTHPAK